MSDTDYIKPSERPGEGSMLHQLSETEKSHAVADDIARELAQALQLRHTPSFGSLARQALDRYNSVMGRAHE